MYLRFHWPWKSCEQNGQIWSPVRVDIALINKIVTKKTKDAYRCGSSTVVMFGWLMSPSGSNRFLWQCEYPKPPKKWSWCVVPALVSHSRVPWTKFLRASGAKTPSVWLFVCIRKTQSSVVFMLHCCSKRGNLFTTCVSAWMSERVTWSGMMSPADGWSKCGMKMSFWPPEGKSEDV